MTKTSDVQVELTGSGEALIEVRSLAMNIVNTINASLDREQALQKKLIGFRAMLQELNNEIVEPLT